MNGVTFSAFSSVVSLVIVLGLIIALAWLLKRSKIGLSHHSVVIKTLGGISIGPREKLLVVEIADQWYVLGVSSHSINLITQLPKQTPPVANNGAVAPDFIAALQARFKK
jgi:flagellar protein FliO/FliZ